MTFIDPVCKMPVIPATAAASERVGPETIYFCSRACHERFLANPAGFNRVSLKGARPALFISALAGTAAAAALLALYFSALASLSGWEFTLGEFREFWPFIVALAAGFGLQVFLFVRLRGLVHGTQSGKFVAVSGTASGAAMVSCCTHYLANLLPVLGATGLVSVVSQYQVELFWVGIAANLAGIAYIARRLLTFRNTEAVHG